LPTSTDKFGSFSAEFMPKGNCKIFASYKNQVGFTEVTMERGSLEDVTVHLDLSLISEDDDSDFAYYLSFIGIVLTVLIFGIILYKKKQWKHNQITKETKKPEKSLQIKSNDTGNIFTKRQKDVMDTLDERDKAIIKFIMKNIGESTQFKIFNETGIPKASLSRHIKSLEQKNILNVTKIGKIRRVIFSEWFLGKEEPIKRG